jgi:hypothetical protein
MVILGRLLIRRTCGYQTFQRTLFNYKTIKSTASCNFFSSGLKMFAAGVAVSSMCLNYESRTNCEKIRPSFARRLLEAVYAGTDQYGTISDDEEDAINSTGGHWAYGEISHDGLHALLEYMQLEQNSVFYDFGSGLGKVVAQCFLTTNVRKVVGIEMAGTRHTQGWQACERMGKLVELIAETRNPSAFPAMASWFEEQPERDQALSPSFVLRSSDDKGRELRLIHGDCLKVSAVFAWPLLRLLAAAASEIRFRPLLRYGASSAHLLRLHSTHSVPLFAPSRR